jgi:arylsulfatase A-like enzyme
LTCVTTEGPGGNPDVCAVLDLSKQWTDDVTFVVVYDGLKVQAVVNQIQGWDHGRTRKVGTPAIFGMNFQSFSVGQKLTADGYLNAAGAPSAGLAAALDFVDAPLGRFVAALQHEGLDGQTLIVLSAKHGQSPIDISKLHMLIGGTNPRATNAVTDVTAVLGDAQITIAQATEDDVALIWLAKSNDAEKAVEVLEQSVAAGNPAHIATIIHGEALRQRFGNPKTDTRTPDLIVQPIARVIYSGSKKKIAEHGGFAADDTHAALVLSSAKLEPATVTEHVTNMQVAPTILKALGLRPSALDAVRLEGTEVLPEFGEE